MVLEDETGKNLEALKVFIFSIKFLKDDLLRVLRDAVLDIEESDIHWVLTVPAIWDDGAKQFMREAAVEAGIAGHRLAIALEPECASLFCRLIPTDALAERSGVSSFSAGHKYLVVDAGGGTVDISAHQVISKTELRELHRASGGPWGGTTVDKAFEQFMDDITDAGVMQKLKAECMETYLDFSRDFEVKKRMVNVGANGSQTTFTIPVFLVTLIKQTTGLSLDECIKRSEYSKEVTFIGNQNKLRVDASVMVQLFDVSVKNIVSHVEDLLKNEMLKDCKALVMVGGLSDSPVLQQAMKDKFPKQKVIIPTDAVLAVLKGAAIFGYSPCAITERICKYTYGSNYMDFPEEFDSGDESDFVSHGELFAVHTKAGQSHKIGEYLPAQTFYPASPNQTNMENVFYRSTSSDPKYVTDPGCERIGRLNIPLPPANKCKNRSIEERLMFGGTEIVVEIKVVGTGERFTRHINFLE